MLCKVLLWHLHCLDRALKFSCIHKCPGDTMFPAGVSSLQSQLSSLQSQFQAKYMPGESCGPRN